MPNFNLGLICLVRGKLQYLPSDNKNIKLHDRPFYGEGREMHHKCLIAAAAAEGVHCLE